MRKKRFFAMAVLALALSSTSLVFAEEVVNSATVEQSANSNNSNTSGTSSSSVPHVDVSGTIESYNSNTNGFMGVMDGISSNMSTASNSDTVVKTTRAASNFSNTIIQFVLAIIPAGILALTAIELLLLCITPLQGVNEKIFGSSSGGGLEGGSSGGAMSLVSKDYQIALQAGSSGGGEGGGSKGGLADMLKTYLGLRIKTIIICVIIMALVLTPATFNLAIVIAGHVLKYLGEFINWLGGNL